MVLWSNASTAQASAIYQRHQALDVQLRLASQQGYISQDLAPITSGDGSPVANQLSQITTNNPGIPNSAA